MLGRPVSVIELAAYQQDAVIELIAYEPTCGDLIAGHRRLAQGSRRA
jgi:hypothetical protein